jgi:hypothetical protein
MTNRLQLFLILMRTHNHNVRPHLKIFSLRGVRVTRLVRHSRAHIHLRNSHPVNTRLRAGQALFHPVHERGIKAARLVLRIARKRRKATPFTRALEVVLNLSGLRVNQGLLGDNGYSTKSTSAQ